MEEVEPPEPKSVQQFLRLPDPTAPAHIPILNIDICPADENRVYLERFESD